MDRRDHWEAIYRAKRASEVSWHQPRPALSLDLIGRALTDRAAHILDVGGGASSLALDLAAGGHRSVTVLDLSASALDQARGGAGGAGTRVRWVVGDALAVPLPRRSVALWHDRAVFHFLTEASDRARYLAEVRRVVRAGGLVLVATFAADGPERCSGLSVARYSPEELQAAFDGGFELVTRRREIHRTPSGAPQPFTYILLRHCPQPSTPD